MTVNTTLNTSTVPIPVISGGTGLSTATTAYTVICAGTTATGNLQPLSSIGTAGQVLTSNGAGSLPSWSAAGSSGGGFTSQQIFTTNGTWTRPAGIKKVVIEVMGGGGGGSGAGTYSGFSIGFGGGGASGAYARKTLDVTGISSAAIAVGGGGAGGYNSNGSIGGTSSFGAYVTCTGGSGGSDLQNSSFPGGIATGGDININGAQGTFGTLRNASGAGPGRSNTGSASIMGIGQDAYLVNPGNNGKAGTGYGSGGSGSFYASVFAVGAAGQPGIVIVYEYS